MKALLRTSDSWAPLALRLGLGGAAILDGVMHLGGSALGEGPDKSVTKDLGHALGVPPILAFPAIGVLILAGLLLLFGWFTRVMAFLLLLVLTALLLVQLRAGPGPDGWLFAPERFRVGYYVLAMIVGIALVIVGGGKLSADRKLAGPW